jgi:hypothetical protein
MDSMHSFYHLSNLNYFLPRNYHEYLWMIRKRMPFVSENIVIRIIYKLRGSPTVS